MNINYGLDGDQEEALSFAIATVLAEKVSTDAVILSLSKRLASKYVKDGATKDVIEERIRGLEKHRDIQHKTVEVLKAMLP